MSLIMWTAFIIYEFFKAQLSEYPNASSESLRFDLAGHTHCFVQYGCNKYVNIVLHSTTRCKINLASFLLSYQLFPLSDLEMGSWTNVPVSR